MERLQLREKTTPAEAGYYHGRQRVLIRRDEFLRKRERRTGQAYIVPACQWSADFGDHQEKRV